MFLIKDNKISQPLPFKYSCDDCRLLTREIEISSLKSLIRFFKPVIKTLRNFSLNAKFISAFMQSIQVSRRAIQSHKKRKMHSENILKLKELKSHLIISNFCLFIHFLLFSSHSNNPVYLSFLLKSG